MRFTSGISFALILVLTGPTDVMPAATEVTTADGPVIGIDSKVAGVRAYLGIPFAAPPVGGLRWRAPQPVTAWTTPRPATAFGPSCVQAPRPSDGRPYSREFHPYPPFSEDCLYLNVWTGASSAAERRPVMVWIHGGALQGTGAMMPMSHGDALASKGVVMVSLNYRVNVFGFLAHPDLTRESAVGAGDYGLLDQVAALRWVQRNIAAFGGDPGNVTIFGQSAGAMSVQAHLASPLSRGLFHKAIAQSGFQLDMASAFLGNTPLADAEREGLALQTALGAGSLEELRAMPAEKVLAAWRMPPRPRVDGHFLPEAAVMALRNGRIADVPLLVGWNSQEGAGNLTADIESDAYVADIHKRFPLQADAILALYPGGNRAAESNRAFGHDRMRVANLLWLRERARHAKTGAFFYEFDHAMPGPYAAEFGAFHTAEIPYVFNTLSTMDRPFTSRDQEIADRMSSYWVTFAETGRPSAPNSSRWAPLQPGKAEYMRIGESDRVTPIADQAKVELLGGTLK